MEKKQAILTNSGTSIKIVGEKGREGAKHFRGEDFFVTLSNICHHHSFRSFCHSLFEVRFFLILIFFEGASFHLAPCGTVTDLDPILELVNWKIVNL